MTLREVYVTTNHAHAPSEDEVAYPCEGGFSLEQAGALPWPLKEAGRVLRGFSVEQAGALPLRTSRSGCESDGKSSSGNGDDISATAGGTAAGHGICDPEASATAGGAVSGNGVCCCATCKCIDGPTLPCLVATWFARQGLYVQRWMRHILSGMQAGLVE